MAAVVNDAPVQFPTGPTVVTWTVTDINGSTYEACGADGLDPDWRTIEVEMSDAIKQQLRNGLIPALYNDLAVAELEAANLSAELNQQRRDILARGSVVLQTTEGTRMSTEELQFLNQSQRIVSAKLPTNCFLSPRDT